MRKPLQPTDFAAKLILALGRANLSRALLAREIGIDKSVVTRWAAGQVRPTEHNLLALTLAIAQRVPGFTLDDWKLSEAAFAARVGRVGEPGSEVAAGLLGRARSWTEPELERAHATYGGLWVFLYDSVRVSRIFGMVCEIRMGDGTLDVEVRDDENWHGRGPAFAMAGKLWLVLEEIERRDSFGFAIFWGTTRGRAEVLDGLAMVREFAPSAAPGATHVAAYRLAGSVTGTAAAARWDAAVARVGELNLDDWDGLLDADFVAGLRRGVTSSGTTLRLGVESSLAINQFDLNAAEEPDGPRRATLAQLRHLFAGALTLG